jgi:hypothetical protein
MCDLCRTVSQKSFGAYMWDNIKVTIKRRRPSLDQSNRRSLRQSHRARRKTAESEWKHVTHEEGAPQFSAMPSVNLSPAGSGVDVVIRYIIRAGVRVDTRDRLGSMGQTGRFPSSLDSHRPRCSTKVTSRPQMRHKLQML